MTTFHDWLISQTEQDSAVGDIARDYAEAVSDGLHGEAIDAADLRRLVGEVVGEGSDAYRAVDDVERAWREL